MRFGSFLTCVLTAHTAHTEFRKDCGVDDLALSAEMDNVFTSIVSKVDIMHAVGTTSRLVR